MLYEVNWSQAEYNSVVVADAIKASDNDQFIFIVTNRQREAFQRWVHREALAGFKLFESPVLTNRVHESSGRNLTIYVYGTGEVKEQVYKAPKARVRKPVEELAI